MAKEDLDGFFDAMRNDVSLAEKFAQAVGDFARNEGFSVDDEDVYDHVTNEVPSTRPLPDDGGPRATTMAMGEEGGRMSTMAMGEEGGGRIKPMPPASVTLAIGEEDRKGPRPPRRSDSGVTSAAIGEEDRKTTGGIGEDPARRDPPAHPITTMAVGEETKKPRIPKP